VIERLLAALLGEICKSLGLAKGLLQCTIKIAQ
jgi:hypothetical protein